MFQDGWRPCWPSAYNLKSQQLQFQASNMAFLSLLTPVLKNGLSALGRCGIGMMLRRCPWTRSEMVLSSGGV